MRALAPARPYSVADPPTGSHEPVRSPLPRGCWWSTIASFMASFHLRQVLPPIWKVASVAKYQ
ncbi:MAG: hypothetical protein ACYTFD_16885 [Planctomycetota bacterium]|jgi:hypothetical protein